MQTKDRSARTEKATMEGNKLVYRPVQQSRNTQHLQSNNDRQATSGMVPYERVKNSPNFQRRMRNPNIWINNNNNSTRSRQRKSQRVDVPYHLLATGRVTLKDYTGSQESAVNNSLNETPAQYAPLMWNRLTFKADDTLGELRRVAFM